MLYIAYASLVKFSKIIRTSYAHQIQVRLWYLKED